MFLISLAWQSLGNRKLTTILTLIAVALSVALFIGVEIVRSGARQGFANTISQTDLIAGPRGGSIQLLLYAIFRIGAASNNISYDSYAKFTQHPAVAWTIPFSLGDSHHGFRVVGTNDNFYERYHYGRGHGIEFEEGRRPRATFDVVLGSDVARDLRYRIGARITLSHGLSGSTAYEQHAGQPFQVVGILRRTTTPVDRSLYITLEGVSAVHVGWEDGAPPMSGDGDPPSQPDKEPLHVEQLSAFLLGAKSRIDALGLQREINTFPDEPLQAVIPAVALAELWQTIGYFENALAVVSLFVVVVGLMGMLVSLYASLEGRRREIAILRSIGAGPRQILALFVLESGLLGLCGSLLGLALIYALAVILQPTVERQFGLFVPLQAPTPAACLYLTAVVVCGFLTGLAPALKAYRSSLVDGLSMRL
jgi:putative ABC transport system permease protein